jgi:poly(A) polymerase
MNIDRSILPPEIDKAIAALPVDNKPIYLVGGAIRDHLVKREIHDLDFVLVDKAKPVARRIANLIYGDFYMLDEERQTVRVLWKTKKNKIFSLDFATQQGEDIEADLRKRDFTINAMAIDLSSPRVIIDPLGGENDLNNKVLKSCSETSLIDDSIRTLRGARLAIQYGLTIEKLTKDHITKAGSDLPGNSPERIRDELLKIFEGPKSTAIIHLLIFLELFDKLFPGMQNLLTKQRIRIFLQNKLDLTLSFLEYFETIIDHLSLGPNTERRINQNDKLMIEKLGKFRNHIKNHFDEPITFGRSRRAISFLAALFRFTGLADLDDEGLDQSTQINTNQSLSEQIDRLALSNEESEMLGRIFCNQGRVHRIRTGSPMEYPHLTYNFFRECGEEGIDLCLFALADFLAIGGIKVKQNEWLGEIETCRMLMEAWWEHRNEKIFPPRLVNGEEIIKATGIPAGPKVGEILESISEAQALGDVSNKAEALNLTRKLIERTKEINHE